MGKWPLIDENWREDDFDLTEILVQLGTTTTSDFGLFDIDRHYTETGKLKLIVKSPKFPEKLTKDKVSKLNKNLLEKLFDNKQKLNSKQEQDLEDVVDFEMKIIQMQTPESPKLKLMNFTRLQFHLPNIDWNRFIGSLAPDEYSNRIRAHFYAQKSDFLQTQLSHLLNSTKPRTISNYLMLNWLHSQRFFVFHKRNDSVSNSHNNIQKDEDSKTKHRQFCFDIITESLSATVGMAYVYRYVTQENIEGVNRMVSSIQNTYKQAFESADWMGEHSKNSAIRKIDEIKRIIGYPKEYANTENLEKLYKDLDITETDSFYEMIEKLLFWKTRIEIVELAKTGTFVEDALFHKVNAQYSDLTNTINIFAPFLRLPFFDVDVPMYTSFGSLGGIIGHEIGHGFDTASMSLEKNLKKYEIFDDMMLKKYNESVECFKKAYGSYKHPKFMVNISGEASLDENLADNIGAKMAYLAFKNKEKQAKNEGLKLPGFQNVTNDQMFFYGFARVYCDVPLNHEQFESMKDTTYSPNRFRVNGVAMNSYEFAEAFKCKNGEPMNPPNKCVVF